MRERRVEFRRLVFIDRFTLLQLPNLCTFPEREREKERMREREKEGMRERERKNERGRGSGE